jgi:nitrogen fixation protein FixH
MSPKNKVAQKKMRPKKPPSIPLRLFILVVVILLGGAVIRALEDKHVMEQLQIHTVEKQEMQEALGWGSELKIDKKSEPLARIRFMLRDKNRQPIRGANVQIALSHMNDNNDMITQNSITLQLSMVEPGVYRGQTNIPLPGEWAASINAEIGNNTYQVTERVILP